MTSAKCIMFNGEIAVAEISIVDGKLDVMILDPDISVRFQ